MTLDAIEAGRCEYEQDLETYKTYKDAHDIPGYNNDQTVTVYPPQWLTRQQMNTTNWSI